MVIIQNCLNGVLGWETESSVYSFIKLHLIYINNMMGPSLNEDKTLQG